VVAWVVNYRRQTRRPSRLRHVTKSSSPQVFYKQHLTNCDARNSFRIRSYENCRVVLVFLSKDLGSNLKWTFPIRALGSLFSLFPPRAFHNSFPFRGVHTLSKNSRMAPPSWSIFGVAGHWRRLWPILFLFKPLRTLLHLPKAQLLYFQAIAHSLPKTTRGGGTPLFHQGSK
jgi:hypothetical protein